VRSIPLRSIYSNRPAAAQTPGLGLDINPHHGTRTAMPGGAFERIVAIDRRCAKL
jgi:hypothetical protein